MVNWLRAFGRRCKVCCKVSGIAWYIAHRWRVERSQHPSCAATECLGVQSYAVAASQTWSFFWSRVLRPLAGRLSVPMNMHHCTSNSQLIT